MAYVHGYEARESARLDDQAGALVELLHHDTTYAPGSRGLEAGCGIGSQTITLLKNSPQAQFTSVDISETSLAEARRRTAGFGNVEFRREDIFALPFEPASFDHVFVCFVLEHLSEPVEALVRLRGLLKPGGSLTVIEGDHGSTYFHPDSDAAQEAIRCQVELQRRGGGDANIGRRLYPVVSAAGYADVRVSPRMVYVDSSRPNLVEAFTKRTFTAMIEGVRESALAAGLLSAERFDRGIRDL